MHDNSPQHLHVSISSGTIVRTILFLLFFAVLFLIRDIVLVVLTAIVFASAIEPMTKWFGKYGVSRLFSVIFIYFVLGALGIGLFYSFVPTLLSDTANVVGAIPRYIDSVSIWDPLQVSDSALSDQKEFAEGLSQGIVESRQAVSEIAQTTSFQEIATEIGTVLNSLSSGFVRTASAIFGGALSLILILVISFYLAVQEDGIAKFLRVVIPKQHEEYVIGLWKRSQLKIGFWLQGQLLLAVLVGILVYLGLSILGIPNALFYAAIAAVMETIPLFGPIIAAIPAVAAAYIDGGLSQGLLVVGLYLIIQQFENHLIYPLVVKKIVGVPPILVILALIIGGKLGGFLGLILSVPVAATLLEYFDDLERKKAAAAARS